MTERAPSLVDVALLLAIAAGTVYFVISFGLVCLPYLSRYVTYLR